MARNHSKIRHAIELLEGLEKKGGALDFQGKYAQLKETLMDVLQERKEEFHHVQKVAQEAIDEGRERVEEVVCHMDKQAHKNPWAFVSGTALVSLLLGFILGHSKK